MFDRFFHPSCPCDPAAKAWVEERLQWLEEEFDDHAFNGRRMVLPTPQFFPDPYDGTASTLRALFERVCGYMDVVPDLVHLQIESNKGNLWMVNDFGQYIPTSYAGTYQESSDLFTITLNETGFDNPMELVGTIAHELAHLRLLGESRIMQDVYDNELLTDLTVVFFGLGIFLANVPRTWDSSYTKWPGTNLLKPEYMTRPMFGYALGHLAWFRGEKSPAWTKHLHWNARHDFKQAVRFLFEKGQSSFRPPRLRLKTVD